jgi:hypothetical protein
MLERAKEFLHVAELTLEKELYNGCAANCYDALFWITILAMAHAGFKQQEWSHNGLSEEDGFRCLVAAARRDFYKRRLSYWLGHYRTLAI